LRYQIVAAGKLIAAAKAGGTATVTAPGWLGDGRALPGR
jgi:hypothetical protein